LATTILGSAWEKIQWIVKALEGEAMKRTDSLTVQRSLCDWSADRTKQSRAFRIQLRCSRALSEPRLKTV